ncbi:MAG TPA: glycosyltransferase [Longimicrobiales bacterium]|nr:glycosyltransferase [Longimicrobiales bacterium]
MTQAHQEVPDAAVRALQSQGTPLVSVLMACRNGLPFLEQALDSLAAQTLPDWELILVDGGSTDGSAEAARRLGSRATVVSAPDSPPPGEARNRAALRARAPMLAFLDADDCWRADKLERQVALLRATGAVLVYSDCRVVDGAGRGLGRYLTRHRPARGDVYSLLLRENFVPLSTVLVTREAFEEVGGFPPGYWAAADYAFALRVAALGTLEYDEETLADYRVHAGSLTRDFRLAYRENVTLYGSLAAAATGEPDRRRARRALGVLCWRWGLREAFGGHPLRALALFGQAVSVTGVAGAVGTFLGAVASWWRGFAVRVRMARARKS